MSITVYSAGAGTHSTPLPVAALFFFIFASALSPAKLDTAGPLAEDHPQRGFIQPRLSPDLIDQIPPVGKMNRLGIIYKTDKCRWFGRYLGRIIKFKPLSLMQGWFIALNGSFEDFVHPAGANAHTVLTVNIIRAFKNFKNP